MANAYGICKVPGEPRGTGRSEDNAKRHRRGQHRRPGCTSLAAYRPTAARGSRQRGLYFFFYLLCGVSEKHPEGIRIFARSLRRELNVQTVELLPELELGVGAEQGYPLNLLSTNRGSQSLDDRFSAGRPTEFNRIQVVAPGGETEVLGRVGGGVGVMERACRDRGRTLAINLPGTRAVNSIAVYREPGTDIPQHLPNFVRDGAVRTRADVQEQIAILADDVDELLNHELLRLECVIRDVAPGLVADRSISLPVERADVAELAAFEIENRGVFLESVVFVIDHPDVVAVLKRGVVVEGGETGEVGTNVRLADPPVEIHDIGVNGAADSEKEIVLDPVRRRSKVKAFGPYRFCQVANHVAVWAHLGRGPVAQSAVIHGETIVMFGHRDHVFRARVL